jgi:hypothetical protein
MELVCSWLGALNPNPASASRSCSRLILVSSSAVAPGITKPAPTTRSPKLWVCIRYGGARPCFDNCGPSCRNPTEKSLEYSSRVLLSAGHIPGLRSGSRTPSRTVMCHDEGNRS